MENQWVPSDEQMDALKNAIKYSSVFSDKNHTLLKELFEELSKLK